MSLSEFQRQVDEWTSQFTPQYWSPQDIMLRLAEEQGELAREVNHIYGPKKKKADEKPGSLDQEITDMIFTLICLANREKINLDAEWERMVREKLYGRDNQRYERK